jgi:uncharacterized protein
MVLDLLNRLCDYEGHNFWADDVRLTSTLLPDASFTHRAVTDLYLVGLAVAHGGCLATLDGRIPVRAVRGGADAVEIVPV